MKNQQKSVLRLALSFCLALLLLLTAAPQAFAAGNGEITITPSTDGVDPSARTFKAYKILDFQPGSEAGKGVYTVPTGLEAKYRAIFTAMNITGAPTENGPLFDKFVQDKLGAFDETQRRTFAGKILAEVKGTVTPVNFTVDGKNQKASNLDLGYYVIEDETDPTPQNETKSLVSLTTTEPKAELKVKAGITSGEKKIVVGDDTVDYNTAAIHDIVNYKYTTQVPANFKYFERYSFAFEDELCKGLTLKDESNGGFTIKVGSVTLTRTTDSTLATGDYYVKKTGTEGNPTKIEISFKDFKKISGIKAGDAITIEYKAEVNKYADPAKTGNPNKAKVKYSNDPNTNDNGTPKGETPWDEVKTYLTEIEINKTDAGTTPLAGAEFKLEGTELNVSYVTYQKFVPDANGTYWKLKNGTYTTTDPATTGVDQSAYEDINTRYKAVSESVLMGKDQTTTTVSATTGPDGKIKFTGLKPGTYTLTETKAPYGYNKLAKPIKFTIGVKLPGEQGANGQTLTDPEWTYTMDPANADYQFDVNSLTIKNQQGTVIPGLGGVGTTMLYIVASVLFLGAAIFIVSKKRAEQKNR